jgi:hypothetical protein
LKGKAILRGIVEKPLSRRHAGGESLLDDNKKPGQRDISDLKARLGLKKTAASMPAVGQPQPTPPHGQPAAIPSPSPEPQARREIPSPFGQPARQAAPEPAPQPAAPPDPRRDPFAQQQAANLAAFYGIGQSLPGDASGVDAAPLTRPKAWGTILTIGIAAVVALGVGNACGRISAARVEFNHTIDSAGQIREEVDKLAKQLNSVADTLNASQLTKQSQPDFDMSKKLGELDLKKPDQSKLFHTNYYHFEDIAIDRLFNYYNNTIKLYDAITVHAKKTDNDKDAITAGAKAATNAKAEKNYGVIINPEGGLTLAQFAEVGSPVCTTPDKTDCGANELKGFKYRTDSAQSWGERPVKGNPNAIIIPIKKSPLFGEVAASNPDVLAFRAYLQRVVEIKMLAAELTAQQKEVTGDLKKMAEKSKVFTF